MPHRILAIWQRSCSSEHGIRRTLMLAAAVGLLATPFHNAAAQATLPPIRTLSHIVSRCPDSLWDLGRIASLRGGRLLIDDKEAQKVLLYDSTLHLIRTVLDTARDAAHHYPGGGVGGPTFISVNQDTVYIVDRQALAILEVDHDGQIVGLVAARGFTGGSIHLDFRKRAVTAMSAWQFSGQPMPRVALQAQSPQPNQPADSLIVVGTPLDTGRKEEIGALGTGPIATNGLIPMRLSDDYAVLSTGTVALVRQASYRVDWVDATGVTHGQALPHDWTRLTDSAKTAIVDSLRTWNEQHQYKVTINGVVQVITPKTIDASALPDYLPAFRDARADESGNVWLQQWADPAVWDIVNPKAGLIDRVRLPGGTLIAGFAPNVVYVVATGRNAVSLTGLAIH